MGHGAVGIMNFEAIEAKRRSELAVWLNSLLPQLNLSSEASEEELREKLIDGSVLCCILNKMSPEKIHYGPRSIHGFLSAMQEIGLPVFEVSDLEQGSMSLVVESLLALKDYFGSDTREHDSLPRRRWKFPEAEVGERMDGFSGEHASTSGQDAMMPGEEKKNFKDSKFHSVLRSPVMSEPSTALLHHVGHKFHEVFQLKQGRYSDLPAAKLSEMMKSTSLDNAPTQSLLSVVNGILDESIDRKNGEIPHRVACLLRKVVQEIERRISTQAEHIRNQSNIIKAREEKYQSRIRVLETLATGTSEETQIVMSQIKRIKSEKTIMEEKKKLGDEDIVRLLKEKENKDLIITGLKQQIETANKSYEQQCLQLETESKEERMRLEDRIKELENLLSESRKRSEELEEFSKSKVQKWNEKEDIYKNFVNFQLESLRDLRKASVSVKTDVAKAQQNWSEEFTMLGVKLKELADAAANYHAVLAENRKLFNEVQELKGNIRVYCRVRPFLAGQIAKQTTIDYIGENGELLVINPSKQGKDNHRMFKFNKVFAPSASQEEVFHDTQPLIRSVLDGFNVCIFAYGQTGSGKTYTMTGPNASSKKDWGVNYRALNDLFDISQKRKNSFTYEITVQMVEIYNEQVRDLLKTDGSQRRLGIWATSQPNGLAVPDASIYPVQSTSDVLDLMHIGQMNRAVGATALNERSSRSHSVLTVHVRGVDLESGAALRGCLNLVDLAGSERVDRSEATGDRLKEAQHINKSLSALGDVIFALAQKSSHVPYRNSKLTQILQSSLGGQAKTLMFVQLNPDVESYSETVSTLKFAERVSGVELGAARSNKEGKDVRELIEQVASLKDTIARKEEEIERLHLLKDLKTLSLSANGEKRGSNSSRHASSSPGRPPGSPFQHRRRLSSGTTTGLTAKLASDHDNFPTVISILSLVLSNRWMIQGLKRKYCVSNSSLKRT
ncbi:Kinesin-4 [Acorus calamus]|uniref:Kinesin-4 n=1 Tax=Acorus calamus TaxID=4465 RepID=A0AAV9E2W7_ACOCL|nr:Kinesin-4 [Acorus calamus]